MKELSIEEKAKRYDELKVTAQELEHDGCFDKITLFDLFPELKESEGEKIRKELIEYFRWNVKQILNDFSNKDCIAWLEMKAEKESVTCPICGWEIEKQGEQKPAWSEEDENMYRKLHNLIYAVPYCDSRKEFSDWLKSLKDRVLPQPKQEWSDEDERRIV